MLKTTLVAASLALVVGAGCRHDLDSVQPPCGPDQPDCPAGQTCGSDGRCKPGGSGPVLIEAGFRTGGSGGSDEVRLVESGFEVAQPRCNRDKNICVTGGIVP